MENKEYGALCLIGTGVMLAIYPTLLLLYGMLKVGYYIILEIYGFYEPQTWIISFLFFGGIALIIAGSWILFPELSEGEE